MSISETIYHNELNKSRTIIANSSWEMKQKNAIQLKVRNRIACV